ncbi:MAG: hypothetical protein QOE61_3062 [Micromonosporaceae bacterium]|jgi:transcriptional regulator with XRE-family HTH domain|nr:hypothetical protein [Micromonosporaceae bacterium]
MPVKPSPNGRSRQVAKRMRALRQSQHMSVQKLVDRMTERGFPILRASLSAVERGVRINVTVDELCAIADALGVSAAGLLGEASLCLTCGDNPPAGFQCTTCGAVGTSE